MSARTGSTDRSGSGRQQTRKQSTKNAKGDTKVIEYIWREPGVIQATIAWGACRLYFGACIEQRSLGKGERKRCLPSRVKRFFPTHTMSSRQGGDSIRNAANLIIGRRIFKGPALQNPHRRLLPKNNKRKKPLSLAPNASFFRGNLDS